MNEGNIREGRESHRTECESAYRMRNNVINAEGVRINLSHPVSAKLMGDAIAMGCPAF